MPAHLGPQVPDLHHFIIAAAFTFPTDLIQ
jgi:hypothetical protein